MLRTPCDELEQYFVRIVRIVPIDSNILYFCTYGARCCLPSFLGERFSHGKQIKASAIGRRENKKGGGIAAEEPGLQEQSSTTWYP